MNSSWRYDLQRIGIQALTNDVHVDDFVEKLGELGSAQGSLPTMQPLFQALHQALQEYAFQPGSFPWPWLGRIFGSVISTEALGVLGPEVEDTLRMLTGLSTAAGTHVLLDHVQAAMDRLQAIPGPPFWNIALLLLCRRLKTALRGKPAGDVSLCLPPRQIQHWEPDQDHSDHWYDAWVEADANAGSDDYRARMLGFRLELLGTIPQGIRDRTFETSLQISRRDCVHAEVWISDGETLGPAPDAWGRAITEFKTEDTTAKPKPRRWQGLKRGGRFQDKTGFAWNAQPWYLWGDDRRAFRLRLRIDYEGAISTGTIQSPYLIQEVGEAERRFEKIREELWEFPSMADEIGLAVMADEIGLAVRVRYRDATGPCWTPPLIVSLRIV